MKRGAILLEMMLALALFVGAAGYTMMALQDGMASSDRAARYGRAIDAAASTMAAAEAGIDLVDVEAESEFEVEIVRSPSQHAGLTLVEVRVLDRESQKELASLLALLAEDGQE